MSRPFVEVVPGTGFNRIVEGEISKADLELVYGAVSGYLQIRNMFKACDWADDLLEYSVLDQIAHELYHIMVHCDSCGTGYYTFKVSPVFHSQID